MTWDARPDAYVGLLPLPLYADVEASIRYDPTIGSTQGPPYQNLTIRGHLSIIGSRRPVISAGQALDTLPAEARFAAWLPEQPEGTWSGANLWLDREGWHLELYREIGVPRNWASAVVDPISGALRRLIICNVPCLQ